MLRIISALILIFSSLQAAGAPAAALELADDAPDRHIVVPGDTLWDIAAKFLKQPYRWPEVWRLNQEQIRNPHWIYPGQVVVLDRREAQPRLRLAEVVIDKQLEPRVYAQQERAAIPSIPPGVIEPFLSQPLVVEANALDPAPRIVATQEGRVYLGRGDIAYASGVGTDVKLWNIYRPGKTLVDPDNGEVLGTEAVFLGTASLQRAGEPATLSIASSLQEIGRGDRLLPAPRPDIVSYAPRAPSQPVSARVVSVYGAVAEGGRYSILALSRGKKDGVEPGHVLALYRAGAEVASRDSGKKDQLKLPDERYGLVFVFRVFERVAYALVMEVKRPVVAGDRVGNP